MRRRTCGLFMASLPGPAAIRPSGAADPPPSPTGTEAGTLETGVDARFVYPHRHSRGWIRETGAP